MMTQAGRRIFPVLLSGGAGARLWPLSREAYPKQLLSVLGGKTLLQETAMRVADPSLFFGPIVVANAEHRFAVAEQLRAAGISDPTIVLEPFRRGTAPAAAIAALLVVDRDPDAIILVTPVDHWISDHAAFRSAVATGLPAAEAGRFVLFGGQRTEPGVQPGDIHVGDMVKSAPGVCDVAGIVEPSNPPAAGNLLGGGKYLCNSGMLLLPARRFLDELERREPDVLAVCRASLAGASRDLDFLRLQETAFEASRILSIDHAILQSRDLAVMETTFDRGHIASWSALWTIGDQDRSGNVAVGDVVLDDVSGCYLRGEGQLVVALGVEDLVVAATPDVVLVTRRDRDQDVAKLVERLKTSGYRSATETLNVHRPWGYYQSLHAGDRFQVKRITVNPGAKLSLQKHYHRAEHWVVVNGTAIVTRDDEEVLLRENESVFVPLGCTHRIENPGKVPLNLIEVQSGAYLGEDDIVRIQDIYHRVVAP